MEEQNDVNVIQKDAIGFIGLGLMGTPMATRLIAAGFSVNVWNRSIEKAKLLAAKGAIFCQNIRQLVEASQIICLCLTDTAAVEEVVFGEGGIAQYARKEQIIVDFSSINPESTSEFARRLNKACGTKWVDSPVSGGVPGAESGMLAIMAGGENSDLERLRPVLKHLSQRVTHMGAVGSGQITKICNQMIVGCNALVIAEMMSFAQKSGVAIEQIPQALKGGFADSLPFQLLAPRMATQSYEPPIWYVKTLLKDLRMAEKATAQVDALSPMISLAAELMERHGANGFLHADPSSLFEYYAHDNQKPR